MIEVRGTRPAAVNPATDSDGQEQVALAIGPHPDLSETQQKVVGLDYGIRGGKAKIKIWRAWSGDLASIFSFRRSTAPKLNAFARSAIRAVTVWSQTSSQAPAES